MASNALKFLKKSRAPSSGTGIDKRMIAVSTWWQNLTGRDQLALGVLGLFMFVVVGGYGGYVLHESANNQQANYEQAVSEFFWLRGQAGNLSGSADGNRANESSLNEQASKLLTQAGMQDVQVMPAGEAVQLSFEHDNQAVISNVLGSFIQAGMTVSQLNMVQNPDNNTITVQATVTS